MPNLKIHSFVLSLFCAVSLYAQENIPLVYDVENTALGEDVSEMLPYDELPVVEKLKSPLLFADGKTMVEDFSGWRARRNEISHLIQHYEIGEKPHVDLSDVHPRMSGDTLIVDVTVNGQTLTLSSVITYPKVGEPPYALMMGTSHVSLDKRLFDNRPIALMTFNEKQVNEYSQMRRKEPAGRGNYAFDKLYPELSENGAYSEWAWGLSRLLDGLQILGSEKTKIDMHRIGITGCSYAGKMSLYCGAFDERVALVIAQEPGGGGAAAWRVSQTMDDVENIDKTDYNWFKESMKTYFGNGNVSKLPFDQHELVAMICPRAVLVLGNTDYKWLSDEAGFVSCNAAKQAWEKFGIGDRMGYSIMGGHPHCMLPEAQFPEVEAFIDRFLLYKDVDTNVGIAPMFQDVDLNMWISR